MGRKRLCSDEFGFADRPWENLLSKDIFKVRVASSTLAMGHAAWPPASRTTRVGNGLLMSMLPRLAMQLLTG